MKKSKDLQPFIKATTKNVIYKISYITGKSTKQICNELCMYTLRNREKLALELLPFLKRDMKIESIVYSPKDEPIMDYPFSGYLERVNVKIDLNSYEFTRGLAFSLGWSVPKIIAYCIELSMSDLDFMNQYIGNYIEKSMGKKQKDKIVNVIMKDVNEALNEEHSVSALLLGIVDKLKESDQNFNEALFELAEKW